MLFSSPTLSSPSKSILIVDDDEIIVELLAIAFEKAGFKVFKCENGLNAMKILKNNNEHIDFLLTDVQMQNVNGYDLAHFVRDRSSSTKIAIMTGGETDVAAALLQDRTVDYLFPKPFKIKKICEIITAEAQAA